MIRALALLTLLVCAPARAGETLDAIHARGVLRVGTTGDYKPFSFREADGRTHGADIVMAQELAAKLGVRLEIVPTAWARLLPDFMSGKFDVAMGGVSVLPDRAAAGAFSPTTLVDGKRPIARCADAERYTTVSAIDQPGVRVVVNPGASNEQFARANFPHAHLIVHSDNATVFDEIVAGRADVMVTDGIEVDSQSFIHKELCPAHVAAPFTRLEKAYLLPRDLDLQRIVADWLTDALQSGRYMHALEAAEQEG